MGQIKNLLRTKEKDFLNFFYTIFFQSEKWPPWKNDKTKGARLIAREWVARALETKPFSQTVLIFFCLHCFLSDNRQGKAVEGYSWDSSRGQATGQILPTDPAVSQSVLCGRFG
jgi:hypothetical protein